MDTKLLISTLELATDHAPKIQAAYLLTGLGTAQEASRATIFHPHGSCVILTWFFQELSLDPWLTDQINPILLLQVSAECYRTTLEGALRALGQAFASMAWGPWPLPNADWENRVPTQLPTSRLWQSGWPANKCKTDPHASHLPWCSKSSPGNMVPLSHTATKNGAMVGDVQVNRLLNLIFHQTTTLNERSHGT